MLTRLAYIGSSFLTYFIINFALIVALKVKYENSNIVGKMECRKTIRSVMHEFSVLYGGVYTAMLFHVFYVHSFKNFIMYMLKSRTFLSHSVLFFIELLSLAVTIMVLLFMIRGFLFISNVIINFFMPLQYDSCPKFSVGDKVRYKRFENGRYDSYGVITNIIRRDKKICYEIDYKTEVREDMLIKAELYNEDSRN